jgi:hypothetical protein
MPLAEYPREITVILVDRTEQGAVLRNPPGQFQPLARGKACPGVGRDWIQTLLRDMKTEGLVRSTGHGAGAKWVRVAKNKRSTLK